MTPNEAHVDDETRRRYRRGSLDASRAAAIAAHLCLCSACSKRFTALNRASRANGPEAAARSWAVVVRDDDHVVEVEYGEDEVVIRSSLDDPEE